MVWCSYCAKDQRAEADDVNGFTCCTGCGRVLDDNVYSSDPTFVKSSDGQSQLQGNFVRDRQYRDNSGTEGRAYATDSHEKTLEKGRNEISDIADFLCISSREDVVNAAHRLYVIAVERNFTRGRRTNQVAAACLYIICRQEQKPFLLIDFSDFLQTSVYVLGGVFLQLCQLLSLEQHPIMQKPVDPSLFIHRFTDRLVRKTSGQEKKFHPIANMALRLVASMKRDWMQTGRRPSGICGAALFISAHIHGFECTKTDVVSVVHICEGTLTKRLIEFEKTESGSLTPEEFEARAKEYELLSQVIEPPKITYKVDAKQEVLCEHKVSGAVHFAVGLCKSCYEEFMRVSGGLEGGSAPPAFQASEKKRMDAEQKLQEEQASAADYGKDKNKILEEKEKRGRGRPKRQGVKLEVSLTKDDLLRVERDKGKRSPIDGDVHTADNVNPTESDVTKLQNTSSSSNKKECSFSRAEYGSDGENTCNTAEVSKFDDSVHKDLDSCELKPATTLDSPEELVGDDNTFSDIDDDEVDAYLHNQEEIRLKTIIWTEMNKEYLEAQQAKEEAFAASQAAQAAILAAAGADSVELAAAAAAAVAELKKDRKRKREEEKNKGPAETATEATKQMLQTKKLSSKVNYSALENLFDGKNTSKNDEKAEDASMVKEKRVSWADSNVINTEVEGMKEEVSVKEVELDNGEVEDEDEDGGDEREENEASNFELPYTADEYDDDDGYDEY